MQEKKNIKTTPTPEAVKGLPENQRVEYKRLTEELQRRGEERRSATPPRLATAATTTSPRPQTAVNNSTVSYFTMSSIKNQVCYDEPAYYSIYILSHATSLRAPMYGGVRT